MFFGRMESRLSLHRYSCLDYFRLRAVFCQPTIKARMSYQDVFGSSTDSDASFEGFSVTEMTKTKIASSGKQPQKQSGAGFFPEQVPTERELKEPHRKMAVMPMVGLTDQHLDLILLFLWFTWTLLPR